jgi:hypothetical protein
MLVKACRPNPHLSCPSRDSEIAILTSYAPLHPRWDWTVWPSYRRATGCFPSPRQVWKRYKFVGSAGIFSLFSRVPLTIKYPRVHLSS